HGAQTRLVWRLRQEASGPNRREAQEGIAICASAFVWQFANLWRELAITFGLQDASAFYEMADATRALVLVVFPLLFSYVIPASCSYSPLVRAVARLARFLRYPLWLFTPLAGVS